MGAKTVMKFDWATVNPRVTRAMLAEAYRAEGSPEQVRRLKQLPDERLAGQAKRTLGRPPHQSHFTKAMAKVLLDTWVPKASAKQTSALAALVQGGLSGPARTQNLRSKADRVTFLQSRNITDNLIANVRTAFLAAHKSPSPVAGPSSGASTARSGLFVLRGEKRTSDRQPFPHHAVIRRRLDELAGGTDRPQGRLVLPTGAGKTDAVGGWILERLAANPSERVLWISHQQELLTQAVQRLSMLAAAQPTLFERRAREVHGTGSVASTLADPDLDVAAITFGSLTNALKLPSDPLKVFLERPTWVIVDEAHHAGAPAFSQTVSAILRHRKVLGLFGLTATPYPTSPHANFRFAQLFPTEVFRLESHDLVAQRILAVPSFHTVHTGVRVEMSAQERQRAISVDYSPVTLRGLDSSVRNNLVVESWQDTAEAWGKTLVFATSIAHADALASRFEEAGHPTGVLHTQIDQPRSEVLDWFRAEAGPCVLISVGMLTEGVDLPDAETAFLSRPTTSRILMQQMIGRVLRGPASGGKPEANVVYFADEWPNFEDTLEPGLIIETRPKSVPRPGKPAPLAPVELVDDDGQPLDLGAAAEVARAIGRSTKTIADATGPTVETLLSSTTLVGYYRLPARTVPVFEHQAQTFDDFVKHIATKTLDGSAISFFEDDPLPHPTAGALNDLIQFTRANRQNGATPVAPPFIDLRANLGPGRAADAVLRAGAITDAERSDLIIDAYETSIARYAYRSLWHFEEAVEAELRERRRAAASGQAFDPEVTAKPTASELPKLPRFQRDLSPVVATTIETSMKLLPPQYAHRLDSPPPVSWTKRPLSGTWAYWTYKINRSGNLVQQIKINNILRTRPRHFSDHALGYLVYHELLHHLLTGQGHDDEFRHLEALWPNAATLNAEFDTLHERWDTKASAYPRLKT